MPSRSQDSNRIEALFSSLHSAGRHDQLESELARLRPEMLSSAERESWYHLRGLIPYNNGDRRLAFERFTEAHQACPDSGGIAFSLAQEHEFRGEVGTMLELFDSFPFPSVPGAHALAQARYAYLWGNPGKAAEYVLPILDVYRELGIADDTFLHLRGLPFFNRTWAYLGTSLELTGSLERLEAITRDCARALTAFDFERLLRFLSGIRTERLAPFAAETRERAVREPGSGFSGYWAMQAAVLDALSASSYESSKSILDGVSLRPDDFPWLEDLRVLAKACLAASWRDASSERVLRANFMRRQPSLFEPDHVFCFRMVGFQQTLLPLYQAQRGRRAEGGAE